MRIWMLASLPIAVAATGGDRGMEFSSHFCDRVIATSPRSNPLSETQQDPRATALECCKVWQEGHSVWDAGIHKEER